MNPKNEDLQLETTRHFLFRLSRNGWMRVKVIPLARFIFLLSLCIDVVLIAAILGHTPSYARVFFLPALAIVAISMVMLTLTAIGYTHGAWTMHRDFIRIGFCNAAGEAPLLIGRDQTPRSQILTFWCKGLTDLDWHEEIAALQSALNLTITRVVSGYDHRTVDVTVVPASMHLGSVIPWSHRLINYDNDADYVLGRALDGDVHINIDKQPMILLAGSTGSGKTMLAITLMIQAAYRGARTYIYDAKGLDYLCMLAHDSQLFVSAAEFLRCLNNIAAEIDFRVTGFRHVLARDINEYRKKTNNPAYARIIVLVDECAEILDPTGRTKEEKEVIAQITSRLNTIARMGRAVGVHLIISTQRPDATAVPGSIKSNLDVRICGKADATLSSIVLGDGRANELIPKDAQGRFVLANGAEDVVFQAFYYQDPEFITLD